MNPFRHALWGFGFLAVLSAPLRAAAAGQVVGVRDGGHSDAARSRHRSCPRRARRDAGA